jgi:hypothetical protein
MRLSTHADVEASFASERALRAVITYGDSRRPNFRICAEGHLHVVGMTLGLGELVVRKRIRRRARHAMKDLLAHLVDWEEQQEITAFAVAGASMNSKGSRESLLNCATATRFCWYSALENRGRVWCATLSRCA